MASAQLFFVVNVSGEFLINALLQVPPSSDLTQERLREGLGINDFLKQRECWLFKEQLNLEIYSFAEDAPVILFLPGIGTYVELYAELLVALHGQGFNVVAVDPPGHGFSTGPRGHFDVVDFSQQLSDIIDHLQTRFTGSWSVYGYSIGAVTALALAERDPRIKSAVCGTLLLSEYPPDLVHALGWSWTSMSAFWFPSVCVPLRSFIDFEALLGAHPAGPWINQDRRIVFDYPLSTLAKMFSYKTGILDHTFPFDLSILQGDCDEVLSIEYAQQIKDEAEQPVRLEVVAGAGHMLPWDDPTELAKRIKECCSA